INCPCCGWCGVALRSGRTSPFLGPANVSFQRRGWVGIFLRELLDLPGPGSEPTDAIHKLVFAAKGSFHANRCRPAMPGDELILSVDVSSVCVLGDQRSFAEPVTD